MQKAWRIVVMVLICLGVGYISSKVTQESVTTWYTTIQKPFFNPPNWVFAPVWTALYIAMGVAAGLVWNKINAHPKLAKKGLLLFIVQLGLNSLWSYLFFGMQNPLLALIEIVILWISIYLTLTTFIKVNKVAGYLFVPYLLWVSFAMILNISIWWLNR
ncbi:sensory protein TspO [Flavobacterium suaedae]|uniref:Sensory protein TspO n=1 Tax=Flavobacterium suaedae TaxID=1767027 RepID=A0ABQ1K276_9FLAO|nr:TspO/MBR family protein [Flavobacterium suaedae]GGB85782.1 sensory protein TspO [Flavobacterium suaedae]